MQGKQDPTWQTKIGEALKRDPKRTGVLGLLSAVLLVLIGRAILGNNATPATAVASSPVVSARTASTDPALRPSGKNEQSAAVQRWLSSSPAKIDRNLFAIKLDYYPQPSGKGLPRVGKSATDDDKSAVQEADVLKEWAARSEAAQLQARQLKLQSTMMSAVPQALISGQMVKEGDVVASTPGESSGNFRVLKIEPRRIIVERDGIKLEILMK